MNSHTDRIRELTSSQVNALLALGCVWSRSDEPNDEVELIEVLKHPGCPELGRLVEDLQSDVLWCDAGPVSFRRLTGANREIQRQVRGKTVLETLTSADTSQEVLKTLTEFGMLLCSAALPVDTRRTGLVIRVAALSALFAMHGVEVEPSVVQLIPTVLDAIESICGGAEDAS